jgi:hypothetical protein
MRLLGRQRVREAIVACFAIGIDGKAESFKHDEMGVFTRVKEKK